MAAAARLLRRLQWNQWAYQVKSLEWGDLAGGQHSSVTIGNQLISLTEVSCLWHIAHGENQLTDYAAGNCCRDDSVRVCLCVCVCVCARPTTFSRSTCDNTRCHRCAFCFSRAAPHVQEATTRLLVSLWEDRDVLFIRLRTRRKKERLRRCIIMYNWLVQCDHVWHQLCLTYRSGWNEQGWNCRIKPQNTKHLLSVVICGQNFFFPPWIPRAGIYLFFSPHWQERREREVAVSRRAAAKELARRTELKLNFLKLLVRGWSL